MRQLIKADDYNCGSKRVNISLSISDYENLVIVAQNNGIGSPGTMAHSILVTALRKEILLLRKSEILPGQQNLFKSKKSKVKE